MTEVRIEEYEGYDEEAFYELLEDVEMVRLCIPKEAVLYQSSHMEIVYEYAYMALLGEKLGALGPGFTYLPPRMDKKDPFVFCIRVDDRQALAGLLYLALDLWEGCSDQVAGFEREAFELIGNYDASACACYDYFVIAYHFMMMDE